MLVQIGRFGTDVPVDNAASARRGSGGLVLSGRARCASLTDLAALRAQCFGLENNPDEPIVPVLVEGTRAGYWRVNQISWTEGEGAYDGLFTADWEVQLDSIDARDAALMEARTMMATTITGGQTCQPWTAIPAQADTWTLVSASPAGTVVTDRVSESGVVRIFDNDALGDGRTQWRQRPEDAYVGAATISAGDTRMTSPDVPSFPGAMSFAFTGATQSYVVPAGVTTVRVFAVGGKGGATPYTTGRTRGAAVTCDLTVTPGETLHVNVGGDGGYPTGYAQTGGAGGWNGGGDGGSSFLTGSRGYWAGGGGGGGATDIRQGGTTVADRVIVAGGGGGSAWDDGGYSGTNGFAGTWGTHAGQGGTATAGGAGGTGIRGTAQAGDAAGVGAGGDGMTDSGGTESRSGGGGGGGGFHGGGGGYCGGSPDSSTVKASSGGGGSSLSTGLNSTIDFAHVDAQVLIVPVVAVGVGVPVEPIDYRVVTGRQILADPWGWMVSNGVVRVRPCYSASEIGIMVQIWTGTAWGVGHAYGIFRSPTSGSYTSAQARATSITVLRNAPEGVAVRMQFGDANHIDVHTVDVSIRRGSWCAEVAFSTTSTDDWACRHDPAGAAIGFGTSGTLVQGFYGTASDADGNTWLVTQYGMAGATVDATNGGFPIGPTWPSAFGVGVALPAEDKGTLSERYFALGAESVRVIAS